MTRMLFHCTHGRDDPERATVPFIAANVAAASGQEAVVLLTIEGAWLCKRGYADTVEAEGFPRLAELLASFTRVASGRYRVRVAGRARTRRFSELDPVRLAGLLDAVPDAERPGVYRRLGDVSLFLTGVFPDYVTSRAFGPVDAGRLLRAAGLPAPQRERERLAAGPAIDLLEHLGARWYRIACEVAPVRTVLHEVGSYAAGYAGMKG